MVEFDMNAMRCRIPGSLPNRMSRYAASKATKRSKRAYLVGENRVLRQIDPPYRVHVSSERTQRGWIGKLTVEIFDVEIAYPAVRHYAPEALVVGPNTEATAYTTEESALAIATSLAPKLIAQLHHETFKL